MNVICISKWILTIFTNKIKFVLYSKNRELLFIWQNLHKLFDYDTHYLFYSSLPWERSTFLIYAPRYSVWWKQFFIQFFWIHALLQKNQRKIQPNWYWENILQWKNWLVLLLLPNFNWNNFLLIKNSFNRTCWS